MTQWDIVELYSGDCVYPLHTDLFVALAPKCLYLAVKRLMEDYTLRDVGVCMCERDSVKCEVFKMKLQ